LKKELLEYMRTEFKTPAVIQCSTATRAGIPYVLYLAEKFSLSFETAMRVARDMELNVTTRENFVQFLKRSIEKKSLSDSEVIFRQLFEKESSTYTYLLGCAETRECLLIDPVLETVERDLRVVDELGLKLKLCVNTHCHADHITGSGEIKKMRKEVKSVISKRAGAMADVLIDEGDVVQVGTSVKLKCLATPGHTDGCVSFVLGDNTDVFTGDALLIRGCGRTDFQGGSSETLFDGVTGKLFGGLPDTCKVWPAHDYKGRMVSTIGEEKRLNPRLGAGKTKEEFVQIMKDLNLPYPKKIDASLPRNLKCGAEE
jgi:sulfur dioxygenase